MYIHEMGKIDAELLLGEGVEAAAFHDTRLGVALDRLDEVGTDRILEWQRIGLITPSAVKVLTFMILKLPIWMAMES
jgi:hypothetical protein